MCLHKNEILQVKHVFDIFYEMGICQNIGKEIITLKNGCACRTSIQNQKGIVLKPLINCYNEKQLTHNYLLEYETKQKP